jgi:hypothetical protein
MGAPRSPVYCASVRFNWTCGRESFVETESNSPKSSQGRSCGWLVDQTQMTFIALLAFPSSERIQKQAYMSPYVHSVLCSNLNFGGGLPIDEKMAERLGTD